MKARFVFPTIKRKEKHGAHEMIAFFFCADRRMRNEGSRIMRTQYSSILAVLGCLVVVCGGAIAQPRPIRVNVENSSSGGVQLKNPGFLFSEHSGILLYPGGAYTLEFNNTSGCGSVTMSSLLEGGLIAGKSDSKNLTNFGNVPPGYYELGCVSGGGARKTATLAIMFPGVPAAQKSGSKMGIYGIIDLKQRGQLLDLLNVRWSRRWLPLRDYEKRGAASFDIAPEKKALSLPSSIEWINVFTPIPIWLRSNPQSARDPLAMSLPADGMDFEALIKRAIADAPETVRFLEPLNEPESHWIGDKEQISQYFCMAKKALGEKEKGVQVLGPSSATLNLDKLESSFSHGLLECIDGLAVHTYGNDAPETYLVDQLNALHGSLVRHHKADIPIYVTEFGWNTISNGWQSRVTSLQQAQYLVRASLIMYSVPQIKAILGFAGYYHPKKSAEIKNSGYSMLNEDFTATPALVAYSYLSRVMASVHSDKVTLEQVPGGTFKISFLDKNDRPLSIVWRKSGTSRMELGCSPIEVADMFGTPIRGQKQAKPGRFEVDVGESLIYLYGCP